MPSICIIRIKRVYEEPAKADGKRILVDRLWPRGLTKEKAQIAEWVRDVSPSNELRKWYGHDPAKWTEFRQRYFAELDGNSDAVEDLRKLCKGTVTFVFSSKEEKLNNAVALRDYLGQ